MASESGDLLQLELERTPTGNKVAGLEAMRGRVVCNRQKLHLKAWKHPFSPVTHLSQCYDCLHSKTGLNPEAFCTSSHINSVNTYINIYRVFIGLYVRGKRERNDSRSILITDGDSGRWNLRHILWFLLDGLQELGIGQELATWKLP